MPGQLCKEHLPCQRTLALEFGEREAGLWELKGKGT